MSKYNALMGMANISNSIMQIINPSQTISIPIISTSSKPPDIPIHIKDKPTPEELENWRIEIMLKKVFADEKQNLANFSINELEETVSWINLSLNNGSNHENKIYWNPKEKEEGLKIANKIIKGKKTLKNGDNFDKWNNSGSVIYNKTIYKNERIIVENFLAKKIKSIIIERKQAEQARRKQAEKEKEFVLLNKHSKFKVNKTQENQEITWKNIIKNSSLSDDIKDKLLLIKFSEGENIDLYSMNIIQIVESFMYRHEFWEVVGLITGLISLFITLAGTLVAPAPTLGQALIANVGGISFGTISSYSSLSQIQEKITEINTMSYEAYGKLLKSKIKFMNYLSTLKRNFSFVYEMYQYTENTLDNSKSDGILYNHLRTTKEWVINYLKGLFDHYKMNLENWTLSIKKEMIYLLDMKIKKIINKIENEIDTPRKMYNFYKNFIF